MDNVGMEQKVLAEQDKDNSWTLLQIERDQLRSQTFLMQKAHAPRACHNPIPAPQHRDAAMRTVLAVKKQGPIPCWKLKTQVVLGQCGSRLESADRCWQLSHPANSALPAAQAHF